MGSAPITQSLIDQVRQVFPKAAISNGYGTTEAGPVVFGPHPEGIPQPELSTGYPHPEVQLRLVRDGKEVDDEGELQMKCGALMTHYHKLPETTAKVMTPDGYYRTSDVFRRDENGFFYFVGRVDDMFVCGGENIYPGEVEKMLERHPGIHQAAVIPVPDELKGHKPVAFVVRANGADVDEQAVKTYALANAPAYQHPRRVFFVDEMPLAGTNKIDKRVLAKQMRSRRAHTPCHPERSEGSRVMRRHGSLASLGMTRTIEKGYPNESSRRSRPWRARGSGLRNRLPRSRRRARAT